MLWHGLHQGAWKDRCQYFQTNHEIRWWTSCRIVCRNHTWAQQKWPTLVQTCFRVMVLELYEPFEKAENLRFGSPVGRSPASAPKKIPRKTNDFLIKMRGKFKEKIISLRRRPPLTEESVSFRNQHKGRLSEAKRVPSLRQKTCYSYKKNRRNEAGNSCRGGGPICVKKAQEGAPAHKRPRKWTEELKTQHETQTIANATLASATTVGAQCVCGAGVKQFRIGAAGRGPMNPQQNAFGDTVFVISGSFPWKSTEPDSLGAFLGVGGLLFGND